MNRLGIIILLVALINSLLGIPQTIHYQGKLTDMSGVGENDILDIRFRVFDIESGGDSLWAMTVADVPIVHGMFDVNIGPIDLPFDEQYWLEIEVGGSVLEPRVQLTSSPYAFRAALADSFTGGISPWTQDTMIAHWDSLRGVPAGLGLPGGSDGQVQFNNGGAFGGSADFIFDNSTGYVGIGSPGALYPLTVYKSADMIFAASIENRSPSGWGLEIRTLDTSSTRSSLEIYNGFIQNIWVRNNGNVGIGIDPTCKLDVAGKTRTTNLQMTSGATDGFILRSDATGNASWVNPATIATVNDSDWIKSGSNMYSGVSGNVGIGTTAPNRMLTISGSSPEIQFNDTDTTNKWHIGQNSGSFFITETDIDHRFAISAGGNVGIGTISPDGKIEVFSNSTESWPHVLLNENSDNFARIHFTNRYSADYFEIAGKPAIDPVNAKIQFCYDGVKMTIQGTGKVGIGTTDPQQKMHVAGGSLNYYRVSTDGFTGLDLGQQEAGNALFRLRDDAHMIFYTNNIERVRLTNDGKVGIGTTNPVDLLHVQAYDSTDGVEDGVFISVRNTCNDTFAYSGIRFKNHSTDGNNFYKAGILWQRTDSWGRGNMIFAIRNSNDANNMDPSFARMIIKGNGDIGIGTTEPSAKLHVNGDGNFTGRVSGADAVVDDEFVTKGQITYEVGDFAQGGIVFWVDESGQHGLVCAKQDQSAGIRWYAGTDTYTMAKGNGPYAGEMNTAIIIANQGYGDGANYAARLCNEVQITEGGITYADWYLPSKEELNLMYQNKATIDATAGANGGSAFADSAYWSSSENDNTGAWAQAFDVGVQASADKINSFRVRAVRGF